MASLQAPNPQHSDDSSATDEVRDMTQAERIRWMQSQAVMANAGAIRQRTPEVPAYLAITHTINRMVTEGALTPEEYLRWTSGLMKAARRPMFYVN